jgi:carbamoyl-phosphate synthase small subunit
VKPGFVVLADGTVLAGTAAGAPGVATGEIVFNTAMSGYLEIITDPSYAGQVITFTSPHIGNYGVNHDDEQADRIHARGLVMRSLSTRPSSWRSEGSLGDYLLEHGVVAVTDVDTRRLTRRIRRFGSMPVALGTDVDVAELVEIAVGTPSMAGRDLVSSVTTTELYHVEPAGARRGHVVAYDFGIKRDIVAALSRRGLAVTVVPATMQAREVLALAPDGVFLSNGPGDPEPLTGPIEAVRALLGNVPIFGICLGHQLLALALGAETYKLPFGHHGGNHPVRCVQSGIVDITAQNHGFAVDLWSMSGRERPTGDGLATSESVPRAVDTPFGVVDGTHQNLNDGTNEGIACRDVDAFSVQYHPEAAPGPNDAARLFDQFARSIGIQDA